MWQVSILIVVAITMFGCATDTGGPVASQPTTAVVPSASSAQNAGTPVTFDESKLDLLNGRWAGKLESRGQDGRIYFGDSVGLEVSRETPAKGKFSMGGGQTWETPIEAKGGKVVMGFGRGRREFILTQTPDGKLMLQTSYDTQWEGQPRINTVILNRTT